VCAAALLKLTENLLYVSKYTETNFKPAADGAVLLCSMEMHCCVGGRVHREQTTERKVHCYADCKDV
jgi:hypothetical protein